MLTCSGFVFQLHSRERTFSAFDDRQVSCKELEGLQIGLEAIKLSLKDLDELKRTVNEKLLTLDKEILEIHREMDKSGRESKRLRGNIGDQFPERRFCCYLRVPSPPLQRRNLAYLRELDEKSVEQECKTIDDALDKLREITDQLGVISNEGFEVAFKRLTEIKEDSARHTQDLSDIRSQFIKLIRELNKSNQKQLLERI